jgi:hypothetical protein
MVLGLNGAGATNLDQLSFQIWDKFDELDAFDGVWISDNGTDWTRLHDGNSASAWTLVSGIDMTFGGTNPVNLSGDFYLMFSQDDNTYWNGNDGIAFDDILIGSPPPPAPGLHVIGTCGIVPSGLGVTGATPNAAVVLVYGFGFGSAVIPGPLSCNGVFSGLDVLNVYGYSISDANGNTTFYATGGVLPAAACGVIVAQVLDKATCTFSLPLAL